MVDVALHLSPPRREAAPEALCASKSPWGSSSPVIRTIKGLQKRYSHRKTLILSGFFLFLWAKFQQMV